MGILRYMKEEYQVIKERDPAIKSPMEVLLYPTFHVMLSYRRAHRFISKGIISGRGLFRSAQPEKQALRSIRERRLARDFLSITEAVSSSARRRSSETT